MFQNFDKLMILKTGQEVYNDDAGKIVDYMESIKVKVDYRMNPADFFMLELSSFKESQGHRTKMTAERWEKDKLSLKGTGKSIVSQEL